VTGFYRAARQQAVGVDSPAEVEFSLELADPILGRVMRSVPFAVHQERSVSGARRMLGANLARDPVKECCVEAKNGACNVLYSASHAIAAWLLFVLCGCRRMHGYGWVA